MDGPNKPIRPRRSPRPPRPDTTGILVVDKPEGPTSMDVVATVRRRAGGAKTGHAGTLDPLATGVLVVALGRATKSIDRFMATDKRYRTEVDLSAFTTTDDREGDRTEVDVAAPPSEADVRAILKELTGTVLQKPPAASAVKVGGRRAYKLARRGDEVDLPARPVTIYSIELLRYAWPVLELAIHCAKGTYIRSLARDLGTLLGTGGHCRSLRRTAVGPFCEADAVPLDEVPDPLTESSLMDLDQALARLEAGQADSG